MTQIDHDSNCMLLAILAELEVFNTIDDFVFEASHPYVWNVQHVGIPYRPAVWFGGALSGSRRKAISRAALKLTREGLVERMTEKRRDRVTHLRFTPVGFRRALELADGRCDLGQLTDSLARIDWSDAIGNVLDSFIDQYHLGGTKPCA